MPRTEISTDQIYDGGVQRDDLDVSTPGQAVIRKFLIAGNGLQITSTGTDSGTGDVTLELGAGNFGTQYYSYSNNVESTTTSDLWVLKAQVSTPIIPAGKYIVHYRAQITNTSKKQVGFQVNWRLFGVTPFATIEESLNAPVTADVYETRAAFDEIEVTQDGQIDIQVQFGQTVAGGTGKIREVVLYLFKVGEI